MSAGATKSGSRTGSSRTPRKTYPVCVDGDGACPPEDCGRAARYLEWRAAALSLAAFDAAPGEAEEVLSLENRTDLLEEVGLSLAESKALLFAIQHRVVALQTEDWMKQRRRCETCGRRLRVKGQLSDHIPHALWDIRLVLLCYKKQN